MGVLSRVKSVGGNNRPIPSVASAATLALPDDSNVVYVSGSTTVTSLDAGNPRPGRHLTIIGATSASVTFTNTTGSTTAGQMDLGGESILVSAKDILRLVRDNNGVWQLIEFKLNNAVSQSLASAATVTVPSSSDIFVVTGSTDITSLSAQTTGKIRRVTFIGGSSCNVKFTNTNSPSTGQMYLQGTNRILLEQDVLVLILQTDGTWFIESTTIA